MKNHVMKTNRAFKEFCVLGGLAYSVCGVAQERPNIIVFLVDDMGLMDTSVPFLADESGQPSLTGLTLKVITGLLSDHPNGTGKVSERICLLCPESCNKPDIRRFM